MFYCEEAFRFLESCGMEDESYFLALIRMYNRALCLVSNLPPEYAPDWYAAELGEATDR